MVHDQPGLVQQGAACYLEHGPFVWRTSAVNKLPVHENEPLPATLPPVAPAVSASTERQNGEEVFCKSLPAPLVQARRAFQRDLPRLLRECPRHWVAYRGDGQVAGPDPSKTSLFQHCLQKGLQPGDFLLLAVSAESGAFLMDVDL